jgi:predicted glycoside hydrolase/deacetylase ChbG (UPF0249 family)
MPTAERRLIINADDLGRTPGINAGIFEAYSRGLVTSATLMVGFSAAEEAAAQLSRYPELGVGLHVALTGGAPILPPEQVQSLVDEQGRLPRGPEGLERAEPRHVQAETEAQLERFQQLTSRPPTHLDSHHHSHRLPVVCDLLVTLARRSGLPVRNASPQVGERLRRATVATTDAFVEDFFGPDARLEVLLRILTGLGPGVTEIMCHPAHVDDELRHDSSYVDERARELEVLTHPDVRQAVLAEGIQLTHFGRL